MTRLFRPQATSKTHIHPPLSFLMVVKRPEDAFMALLTSYHSRQFCRAAFGARARAAAPSRFSTSALLAASQRKIRREEQIFDFSQGAKIPENIAIIGSGITGLTTAHYLAKWLPPTSRITIFDSAERTGGWINTETHKPVVDGRQYTVRLERGPRTLRGMGKDTWKFHDFVLGDMVRCSTLPPLPCALEAGVKG